MRGVDISAVSGISRTRRSRGLVGCRPRAPEAFLDQLVCLARAGFQHLREAAGRLLQIRRAARRGLSGHRVRTSRIRDRTCTTVRAFERATRTTPVWNAAHARCCTTASACTTTRECCGGQKNPLELVSDAASASGYHDRVDGIDGSLDGRDSNVTPATRVAYPGAVTIGPGPSGLFYGDNAIDEFREHGAEGPGFEISREQAAGVRLTSTRAHRAGDCAVVYRSPTRGQFGLYMKKASRILRFAGLPYE